MSSAPAPKSHCITAVALAAVLPLLLLAAAGVLLTQLRSGADLREDRNAGFVLNGKPVKGGIVKAIERVLQTEPEVIILGNSLSNTDLLPGLLAQRLGIPKSKVQKFSIPNSLGAHWYAVLKNRVYANGHQPRLVILLSDMQSALAVEPRTEPSYVNLSVQLDREGGEPVIDGKMGRRNWAAGYLLDEIREEREDLRDTFLKGARNASVDLLYWHQLGDAEHARTSKALDRVFADDRTDMRLHHSVIPIMSVERELVPYDPADLPLPKDSFIPDIVDLVNENGGKAVFLRPPMSPLLPEEAGDLVLEGIEGRVYGLVQAHDGYYLDLRTLEMSDGHFHNVDHMNPEGARRFTEAVAQILNQLEPPKRLKGRLDHEAELFTVFELASAQLAHRELEPEFRDEPPPFGRVPELIRSRPKVAYFDLPGWSSMSDDETTELTPFAARCSPLRVVENGERLPLHSVPCEEAFKHGGGRVCHHGDRLFVTATDDTNPAENGRTYDIELAESRWCEGALWLYPNDRVRVPWNEKDLMRLERGGRFFTVAAQDMGGRGAATPLTVRLRVNGNLAIDDTLPLPAAMLGTRTFNLPQAIPPKARQVVLEVVNNSDRYVLLTHATLSERKPSAEPVEDVDDSEWATERRGRGR